ncbi:uncharacterized protein LOC123879606 [Maniola jurtina]|uniref:uncharacterized protein LOC123879388 n=1 Tax=Maniola jurtina TaxID=191418 RepID=UPI001E6887EE|nr:uncharacterized protein LOC123879388 [Maniola jurtina]XP_045783353.1 uncharacterized protein LOC123879606 [Maniola jurtina]XP_045783354.1 uncharacterized protein LOC123879606 [Maniola jurtina]
MKSSVTLVLAVAVFSTLFLGSSGASVGAGLKLDLGIIDKLLEGIDGILGNLIKGVAGVVDKVGDTTNGALNGVNDLLKNATGETADLLNETKDVLSKIPALVNETSAALSEAIKSNTTEAWNKVNDWVKKITSTVDELQQLQVKIEANANLGILGKEIGSVVSGLTELSSKIVNVQASVSGGKTA